MHGLGPGNDSGDPDVILEAGYDNLMRHLSTPLGEPLVGIVALNVETEDGDRGLFTWKYGHAKPKVAMAATNVDDPLIRLGALFSAVECAAVVAEREGLTVAG